MIRLNRYSACLVVLCGGLVSCLLAADPKPPAKKNLTPRALVTEGINDNAPWQVRVSVDRENRTYKVGEEVKITVRSEEKGYLYLIDIDPDGEPFCLFPNDFQKDNQIEAGKDVTVPAGGGFRFKVGPPVGKEMIKAIVMKEPAKSLKPSEITAKGEFKQVPTRLVKALLVEAVTGKQNDGNQVQTIQEIKDKEKQQNPDQFQQQSKKWAENSIDIFTVDGAPPPPAQKRVGVFIGINKFKDTDHIRNLKCSRNDAEDMERMMRQVKAVDQTKLLLDADATLGNIQKAIYQDLQQTTQPGDTVIIYWSGHGGRCADTTGKEPSGQASYLVPHDGMLDSEESSMLLNRTFARWIQALEGRKVIVIFDTCHSGGQILGAKKLGQNNLKLAKVLKPAETKAPPAAKHMLESVMIRAKNIGHKDAVVLASCTPRQYSFERREEDNGVMTFFLLDFLKNQNGPLTIDDAHKYISPKVKKYVEDNVDGSSQDPLCVDDLHYQLKPGS